MVWCVARCWQDLDPLCYLGDALPPPKARLRYRLEVLTDSRLTVHSDRGKL